jgi:hypothetical protein
MIAERLSQRCDADTADGHSLHRLWSEAPTYACTTITFSERAEP